MILGTHQIKQAVIEYTIVWQQITWICDFDEDLLMYSLKLHNLPIALKKEDKRSNIEPKQL